MATFLRSLQFIRRLSVQGRRLGCSSATHVSNTQLLHLSRAQCALLQENRTYVTKSAYQTRSQNDNKIDNLLNDLDQRVRNYRAIYKKHVDEVLNAVTEKGSLSNMQALLLIRCCGEFLRGDSIHMRNTLTDQIWQLTKELNVPIDVSHYNALLLVYHENERDFSPVDILMEMKTNQIEPNHVTFQRLIKQYCNKGDIAGVTKILEHMSEKEIPINENIFNSLIKGHSEAGDIPNAIKILSIMKNAGIEPTSRTYSEILCVYAKVGDIESIRSTFNECREKSIQLSDKEILDVIYTLAINQHLDMIDEMITFLTKGGLYNKAASNCIFKLIEKDNTDVAYKLLKTLIKPDRSETYESGGFFLRKLVTSGATPETIIKYCNLLKEEKLHNNPFELAIIHLFSNDKQHSVLPVMKYWSETGAEIREHYFFPIFVAHSKDNNLQGLLNTVKSMVFDFKVTPSITTVKDYVVPFLVEDPSTNLQTLTNNHLSFSTVAHAILLDLLARNRAQQAYQFISSTNLTYRLVMLTRPLALTLADIKDPESIAGIVHHQYVMAQRNLNQVPEDKLSPKEFSSAVLYKAAMILPQYDTTLLTKFLQSLLERGVGIEQEVIEKVKLRLENNFTPEIENLLNALASDSLESKELQMKSNSRNRYNNGSKDSEESQEFYKMLRIQNQVRNEEHEAIEQSLAQLEQENIKYTAGFSATMIHYYSGQGKLEEATKWFNRLKEIDPDFKLNKIGLFKYASALVRNNQIEEAIAVLKYPVNDADTNRNQVAERLLESVLEVCPARIEEFLELLHSQKLVSAITSNLLSPLVRAPLKAGNVEQAIEKYKWACEKYKVTPYKILIMSHLINKEDAKTLKYVTDLSTKVHGEVNSLIDLAVAFFECNRPHQARKILETPGLRLSRERMRMTIEKYYNYDEARLEGFIKLLHGLILDLDSFYILLLKSYGKKGKWEKCLALWTQMQEDNIQPSTAFMDELEQILSQCNQQIPFATSDQESSRLDESFNAALLDQDVPKAEKIFKEMPVSENRTRDGLRLAETFLTLNNVDKTLSYIHNAIDENPLLIEANENLIRNITEKLVEQDRFQDILKLYTSLNSNQKKTRGKKSLPYTRFLNECYLQQGKYNEFLSHLEKCLDEPNNVKGLNALFHMTFNTKALCDHPEYLPKYKNLSAKALKSGNYLPLNSLYGYYLVKEDPQADVIFNDHLKNTNQFYGMSAMFACTDYASWQKVPKVVENVVLSNAIKSRKQKTVIKIFLKVMSSDAPKKYEIAYECLRQMSEVVPLERIHEKYITELKANLPDNISIDLLKSENDRVKNEATG